MMSFERIRAGVIRWSLASACALTVTLPGVAGAADRSATGVPVFEFEQVLKSALASCADECPALEHLRPDCGFSIEIDLERELRNLYGGTELIGPTRENYFATRGQCQLDMLTLVERYCEVNDCCPGDPLDAGITCRPIIGTGGIGGGGSVDGKPTGVGIGVDGTLNIGGETEIAFAGSIRIRPVVTAACHPSSDFFSENASGCCDQYCGQQPACPFPTMEACLAECADTFNCPKCTKNPNSGCYSCSFQPESECQPEDDPPGDPPGEDDPPADPPVDGPEIPLPDPPANPPRPPRPDDRPTNIHLDCLTSMRFEPGFSAPPLQPGWHHIPGPWGGIFIRVYPSGNAGSYQPGYWVLDVACGGVGGGGGGGGGSPFGPTCSVDGTIVGCDAPFF